MERCIGRRDITEILLKTVLNTIHSIDQNCKFKRLWSVTAGANPRLPAHEADAPGKGENAGNQDFLFYPERFQP